METNNKICKLSISFKIVCDGLLGDKYEYDPKLAWHTSFGDYRIKEIDKMIRLPDIITPAQGISKKSTVSASDDDSENIVMDDKIAVYKSSKPIEITLNDFDRMKGDDTLHLKLFSHTRYPWCEPH